jgi:hypothetical protein
MFLRHSLQSTAPGLIISNIVLENKAILLKKLIYTLIT